MNDLDIIADETAMLIRKRGNSPISWDMRSVSPVMEDGVWRHFTVHMENGDQYTFTITKRDGEGSTTGILDVHRCQNQARS
jgi:1,4-alpha-glucan branching enzyme